MADASQDPEFPIVCEACLGTNPYMRMTTQANGKECKICSRPFTTYRWLPAAGERYRRTEVCSTCAKLKNVCQSCVLDLEYGLTTQVRDAMLTQAGVDGGMLPEGDANRRWALRAAEQAMSKSGKGLIDYAKIDAIAKDTLKKMSRGGGGGGGDPGDDAERRHLLKQYPNVCHFWLKGKCHRGSACPYKHALPQNDKDNDKKKKRDRDAANDNNPSSSSSSSSTSHPGTKIMEKHLREQAAANAHTSTLLVTQLPESAANQDAVRAYFAQFGDLKSVVVAKRAAFVNFARRDDAAAAMEHEGHVLDGAPIHVAWGKSRPRVAATAAENAADAGHAQKRARRDPEYAAMNPALI